MMEMKIIHMMTSAQQNYRTLFVCSLTVKILVLLCNVLATANLKNQEQDNFMSPKELVLVLLVCDLEKVFLKYYLGLDYNDELIISAYNLTLDFARTMKDEFDAAEAERFVSSIVEDRNDKIVAYIQVGDSTLEILLIFNHLQFEMHVLVRLRQSKNSKKN